MNNDFTFNPKKHITYYIPRVAFITSDIFPGMYANMGENGKDAFHKILFVRKDEDGNRTVFMEKAITEPCDIVEQKLVA